VKKQNYQTAHAHISRSCSQKDKWKIVFFLLKNPINKNI